ncbi:MAG TPA: RNA polymerase sigma factor [Syntrophales bacterium]|nr:RNA polymerase sigma factor [Syntrophales bacterium]
MKQIDEGEIIGRVLGGDREAFAALVDAYKGPVFRLAFRMTGSTQDAEDLTQETFIRGFQSLGRFRAGERFFPWLYTISLNVIRNHLRKAKAQAEDSGGKGVLEAADPRSDPTEAAIGREQGRRMQGYLLRLPVPVREAVILRFYEGMSFEDITSVTGDTLSSAKMKVYRGLEKMRTMMEADGFSAPE